MTIDESRKEINVIDGKLVELLEKRMRAAEDIAEYKKEHGLPIEDARREREHLDEISEKSSPDLAGYNRILFRSIFEMSKDHQYGIAGGESELVREVRDALADTPEDFPDAPNVACQGTLGAFAQEACDKLFKRPKIMYTKNFRGVFSAIENGLCEFGVLPVENSTAGSVNQVYDLMMEYNFHIARRAKLKINHCLLALPGTRTTDIREIVSHPQALSQCEEYLKRFAMAKITGCENTAEAAKTVASSGRNDVAAICSAECGKLYGLECLESGIQDSDNNYTRFICITKDLRIYPGADKTSLMMTLEHKPGSLYNVLSRFNALGINLEKLESRPLPSRDFEFMFYFDIAESVYSDEFIRMLKQLNEMSPNLEYLGSYREI